ncbi:MAG: hypothetical protein H0U84_06765 [Thermoleophilaceae bacterium]|nr:hypothetical protein [Thermoleophilaceae bacterium]
MPINRRLISTVALSIAALSAASPPASAAGPYDSLLAPTSRCANQTSASASLNAQASSMYCLINYARERSGVPALTPTALMESAARKARDIMRCQQFSHTACGRDYAFHIRAVGYGGSCWAAGENLAYGTGSLGAPRSIMSGWLNSTGHRQNMLYPSFRHYGIGLVRGTLRGASGAQVWVTHLGYRC